MSRLLVLLALVAVPPIAGAQRSPGFLHGVSLVPVTDTLESWVSSRTGANLSRGTGDRIVRTLRRTAGRRWELTDAWMDSSGRETARQSTLTRPSSLATEREWVRALIDSASLLATPDRVTAWVVPEGRPPQLFDGPSPGDRYSFLIAVIAAARARQPNGTLLLVPVGDLYGGAPLATHLDTLQVARRDTLRAGTRRIPVVVLRRGLREAWMEEATGRTVLERGSAGPERYWWHVRRGVSIPTPR